MAKYEAQIVLYKIVHAATLDEADKLAQQYAGAVQNMANREISSIDGHNNVERFYDAYCTTIRSVASEHDDGETT